MVKRVEHARTGIARHAAAALLLLGGTIDVRAEDAAPPSVPFSIHAERSAIIIEAMADKLETPRLIQSFLGAGPVLQVYRTLGRRPPGSAR